jgi:hypothetical protein
MLATLSQKRVQPQKHARHLAEEEEEEVSEGTMSRQFRRSPDVSRSESPARRLVPPMVDLTTTLDGRALVIGAEDLPNLTCGPCKDNGIISHGARHLCRCENVLATTVIHRRVKQVVQSLKDNWQWKGIIARGLVLPSTPGPEVVKKIKALGDTDKKLLKLGDADTETLQQVVDDFLSNYWSLLGLPVDPLVAAGLPAFVAVATTAPPEVKVKVEKFARASREESHERGRYESRGRASRRSSGGRRRNHRRDWSTSLESSFEYSRERSDRKRSKKEKSRGGPVGPPVDHQAPPAFDPTVEEAAAAAVVEARCVAAVVEASCVAADAETVRVAADAAVVEAARVAAVVEAGRMAAAAAAAALPPGARVRRVRGPNGRWMPAPAP